MTLSTLWRGALFLTCLVIAIPASAFGLRTHLWIGQRLIEDAGADCALTIAGTQPRLRPELCASIVAHPGHFLSGVLGPDIYPDLITGQVTTHPGIPNDWQTSDWLQHVYDRAGAGPELAFAAGFLVHAASDTFAHSYVNAYSGDIFVLGDERAVERRHFVLEKYIDYRLPAGEPDPAVLAVPAAFVRDALIYNEGAARNAGKSGFALHVPAMYAVRKSVGELERQLDDIERDLGTALADLVATHLDLQAQLLDGELALQAADAALAGQEQLLALEKSALNAAKRALDDAIAAVEANKSLINTLRLDAQIAREIIEKGPAEIERLNSAISDAERELSDLQRRLASTPAEVSKEVCGKAKEVCDYCPDYIPGCTVTCKVVDGTCEVQQVANEAYTNLFNEIQGIKGRISTARNDAANWATQVAFSMAKELQALQEKAAQEALSAGLELTKATVAAAYEVQNQRFKVQEAATQLARGSVKNLREQIATLRKKLVDTESIKEAIASLVAHSNILSAYATNWRRGLDVAGEKYIETGLTVSRRMVRGEGGVFSAYLEWLQCYGSAYTPVPYQVGEFPCQVESFLTKLDEEVDQLILDILPEPFDSLILRLREIKAQIKNEVRKQADDAMLHLAKWAAPDEATADFIELLARPESATAEKLTEVFATNSDADGKQLLVFEDVRELIERDVGIKDGKIVPARFAALTHAGVMSRLALLDANEVRWLTWRLGAAEQQTPIPSYSGRYSILFQTLRSIDGNHQWQPFGLPYARMDGASVPEPASRHYGFGPQDGAQQGFPYYVDPILRRDVFPQLFPVGIAGALANRPELSHPRYPFPECAANAFPLAMNADGTPAVADSRCAEAKSDRAQRPPFKVRLRRGWRAFLAIFGAHRE